MKINAKYFNAFERGIMDGHFEHSVNARKSVIWFDKPIEKYAEYCFNRQATRGSNTKSHCKAYTTAFMWSIDNAEEFKELFTTAKSNQHLLRGLYDKGIFTLTGDNEMITDKLYRLGILVETEGNYAWNKDILVNNSKQVIKTHSKYSWE